MLKLKQIIPAPKGKRTSPRRTRGVVGPTAPWKLKLQNLTLPMLPLPWQLDVLPSYTSRSKNVRFHWRTLYIQHTQTNKHAYTCPPVSSPGISCHLVSPLCVATNAIVTPSLCWNSFLQTHKSTPFQNISIPASPSTRKYNYTIIITTSNNHYNFFNLPYVRHHVL